MGVPSRGGWSTRWSTAGDGKRSRQSLCGSLGGWVCRRAARAGRQWTPVLTGGHDRGRARSQGGRGRFGLRCRALAGCRADGSRREGQVLLDHYGGIIRARKCSECAACAYCERRPGRSWEGPGRKRRGSALQGREDRAGRAVCGGGEQGRERSGHGLAGRMACGAWAVSSCLVCPGLEERGAPESARQAFWG